MMRLILSQFLRGLRERDEFDRLLPDLLLSMGYVPLSKPQTGVRQFGVDLAAARTDGDQGPDLLLFVIKRGDIGRREWDNGEPTSVRPSLNEALDFYLTKLIPPELEKARKTVVLATTGDLKQDIEPVWTAYKEQNASRARFEFWGADQVADLVERHLLDEHLFVSEDRSDLRKALALAGESDYTFRDLTKLLSRRLGINAEGELEEDAPSGKRLEKSMRAAHLACQVCIGWAEAEGDARKALWVAERALLWSWHRVHLVPADNEREKLHAIIADVWHSYVLCAQRYFEKVNTHFSVRDGISGYTNESALFSATLFEHVGHLAIIGLAAVMDAASEDPEGIAASNAQAVADALEGLISNNPASGSLRLDGQIIDVSLAILFLVSAGRIDAAQNWLKALVLRIDYAYKVQSKFPVDSDDFDDLIELETGDIDAEFRDGLMSTSWSLATLAAMCAVLGVDESYTVLARESRESYKNTCAQLWHPAEGWQRYWYFGTALRNNGDAEAPFDLPLDPQNMRVRIEEFLRKPEYDWVANSPTRDQGLWIVDFIACRHFRLPVPASAWYRLATKPEVSGERRPVLR